jgi:hypothetical protein
MTATKLGPNLSQAALVAAAISSDAHASSLVAGRMFSGLKLLVAPSRNLAVTQSVSGNVCTELIRQSSSIDGIAPRSFVSAIKLRPWIRRYATAAPGSPVSCF